MDGGNRLHDDVGRLVDASGTPSERLLAIGAPQRASAWETTSIPDIAVQAASLAERLVPDRSGRTRQGNAT